MKETDLLEITGRLDKIIELMNQLVPCKHIGTVRQVSPQEYQCHECGEIIPITQHMNSGVVVNPPNMFNSLHPQHGGFQQPVNMQSMQPFQEFFPRDKFNYCRETQALVTLFGTDSETYRHLHIALKSVKQEGGEEDVEIYKILIRLIMIHPKFVQSLHTKGSLHTSNVHSVFYEIFDHDVLSHINIALASHTMQEIQGTSKLLAGSNESFDEYFNKDGHNLTTEGIVFDTVDSTFKEFLVQQEYLYLWDNFVNGRNKRSGLVEVSYATFKEFIESDLKN